MTQKEMSEFLRLLAHDLQNQVGAVDLNLQILPTMLHRESAPDSEVHAFIDRAALSTSEMIETLSDLQRYAHALAAESGPKLQQLDLATLLRDSLLRLTPKAAARKVSLALGEVIEGQVFAEREGVVNALRLFATEALRCSFPGETLTLSTALTESGQPSIRLHASQEGLFEAHRPNLAAFLAAQALKASGVKLQFLTGESHSAIQFVFPDRP